MYRQPIDVCTDCPHARGDHTRLAGCTALMDASTYCTCTRGPGAPAVSVSPDPELVVMPTPGGVTFDVELDGVRLNKQQQAVWHHVKDGRFRTLAELEQATGFPQASISARLRDFRKAPLNRDVQRRRRTHRGAQVDAVVSSGTWEYAVLSPEA